MEIKKKKIRSNLKITQLAIGQLDTDKIKPWGA